ncbi:MAG: prenyltransferase/squalene oxidase repeat-containing protein [Candidatus Buchananbacteria bacterium]
MKNKIKTFLSVAAFLAILFQPVLAFADISSDSITYLKAAGQTPWVTMALVSALANNIASDHLTSCANDPLAYAKAILAITALGNNPSTFGNVDYVSYLKSYYSNSQIGQPEMLMDDSFGILALRAAGLVSSSTEIAETKSYLLAKQNTDGGWGYNVGVASDTNSTAIITISLIEAGVSSDNAAISKALAYLAATQNNDGGWGWAEGNESDADSTSWVVWAIRKVGQSPALWQKGSTNPIAFIESLKNSDGSFGRTLGNKTANLMATQDAVIALSEKTLPLGYFQSSNQPGTPAETGKYLFRIEGSQGPICSKKLDGITAYDLLVAGQAACNYTFVGNRTWGTFFLDSINGINNEFPAYWMYLIDNISTSDGLEQYQLKDGDNVLIYFDSDTNSPAYPDYDRPLRIVTSKDSPEPEETVTLTVEYFNQTWQPAAGARVFGADQDYLTDNNGQVSLALPDGYYTLYAEKANYIRSNQQVIAVGNGVSQGVSLKADIDQGGRGRLAGESIIFEVTPGQLDFGKIQPGKTSTQNVSLNNSGTVNLQISASVSGDSVFINNLQVDGKAWGNFSTDLVTLETKSESVSLTIPTSYVGLGIKTGELIFWAQAQ